MSLLLFRALNELDIEMDTLNNGLVSKKIIYDLTWNYLSLYDKEYFNSLNVQEKDQYCKSKMLQYIKTHKHKIMKTVIRQSTEIRKNIQGFKYLDSESCNNIFGYLSTLNNHIANGSRVYTDWISTTKNLSNISKYYEKQNIHKVAVLGSSSGGFADDNTLVLDLSSRNQIEDIRQILPKKTSENKIKLLENIIARDGNIPMELFNDDIYVPTSKKFVGYNYSIADKEVCIYKYFPKENVLSILESLQLDLIEKRVFNTEFLKLSKEEQIHQLGVLKEVLKLWILKLNDPYLMYVFDEIYIKNKNVNDICKNNEEKEKINKGRAKILNVAKNIPNSMIVRS